MFFCYAAKELIRALKKWKEFEMKRMIRMVSRLRHLTQHLDKRNEELKSDDQAVVLKLLKQSKKQHSRLDTAILKLENLKEMRISNTIIPTLLKWLKDIEKISDDIVRSNDEINADEKHTDSGDDGDSCDESDVMEGPFSNEHEEFIKLAFDSDIMKSALNDYVSRIAATKTEKEKREAMKSKETPESKKAFKKAKAENMKFIAKRRSNPLTPKSVEKPIKLQSRMESKSNPPIPRKEPMKRSTSTETPAKIDRKKPRLDKERELKGLHPSWAAQKQKREKESGLVEYKGTKIRFGSE